MTGLRPEGFALAPLRGAHPAAISTPNGVSIAKRCEGRSPSLGPKARSLRRSGNEEAEVTKSPQASEC